jgi:trk system potassium uptake protein TrkA
MKIVIEGAGEVGSHLAKMLSNEGGDITVIDNDSDRLNKLISIADVVTVFGNPSSIKVMREAGVQHSDLFIAVNPFVPQDVNIVSALIAKKMGSKKVTARIDDEEFLNSENKLLFKEMGMDLMFYPEKIAADEIDGLLKHPTSTESMDFARGKLQISVFKLDEDSPILDMQLSDFASNASTDELQFRVIAISRNNETIIPKFDTKFKYHDLVS